MRWVYINIQTLIAIGAFTLIILFYFYVRSLWRPSKNKKIIEVNCTIKNKKIDEWKSSPTSPTARDYYVTFDISSELLEIKLANKEQYDNLSIGQKGILTYQKKRFTNVFVNFKKQGVISNTREE